MKELSKKKKLIGFIAILLIAVIIAIIITTSIVNNNQVSREGYASTTANGDSELIANYIKKGITIGGVTGKLESLNTFDATATAEDIAEGKVAYARGKRIVGTRIDEDIVLNLQDVYYADLEGDGTVDGVIFADLAGEEENGEWGSNGYGVYTIPSETGLKQYYIKGEYIDEHFGTGKVIAPMEGTSGNERFYVMALDNFTTENYTTFYWYNNAFGNLDSSYNVATSANDFAEAGAEPTGRINTERMIASWNSSQYGAQNERDMWGVIQDEVDDGWFVPSKSEWSAFGSAFGITRSNYSSKYGLSGLCWSSSQFGTRLAYYADFTSGNIRNLNVYSIYYVRLATTF